VAAAALKGGVMTDAAVVKTPLHDESEMKMKTRISIDRDCKNKVRFLMPLVFIVFAKIMLHPRGEGG